MWVHFMVCSARKFSFVFNPLELLLRKNEALQKVVDISSLLFVWMVIGGVHDPISFPWLSWVSMWFSLILTGSFSYLVLFLCVCVREGVKSGDQISWSISRQPWKSIPTNKCDLHEPVRKGTKKQFYQRFKFHLSEQTNKVDWLRVYSWVGWCYYFIRWSFDTNDLLTATTLFTDQDKHKCFSCLRIV